MARLPDGAWENTPKARFCSLTVPGSWDGTSPFSRIFLMFVRFLLNRTASTRRRETGPDGPSSGGEYPSGAALEVPVRLASCRGRRPCRPAGRGPRLGSRTGPRLVSRASSRGQPPLSVFAVVHLARLRTSTATIAFMAERSSAGVNGWRLPGREAVGISGSSGGFNSMPG